jgi:hypothetical protein
MSSICSDLTSPEDSTAFRAKHLGSVEATDDGAAIEAAAKEFNVDPKRLMAVRRA